MVTNKIQCSNKRQNYPKSREPDKNPRRGYGQLDPYCLYTSSVSEKKNTTEQFIEFKVYERIK